MTLTILTKMELYSNHDDQKDVRVMVFITKQDKDKAALAISEGKCMAVPTKRSLKDHEKNI